MMKSVVQEVPLLIDEIDLHISQLTIQLLTLILQQQQSREIKPLLADILPKVYCIIKSPLLQGHMLLHQQLLF